MIKDKKITALIQARVSSTRLPKKHFRMIGDQSVLEWILWRLSHLNKIDKIVVSTCKEEDSDLYCQYQDKYDYEVFEYEGDVNDVVGRHYLAAQKYKSDYYLVVSGDCPLIDEPFIEQMLNILNVEYPWLIRGASESIHEGIGFDSYEAIKYIENNSVTPDQRENYGYQIEYPQGVIKHIEIEEKYQENKCRISVDNMADWRFMNALFLECEEHNLEFNLRNVIDFLNENPNLLNYHSHVKQKSVGFKAKKFLFLTEASKEVGLGHLSRIIAMAQELNETYHNGVHFLINDDSVAIDKLKSEGYIYDYTIYKKDISTLMMMLTYDVLVMDLKHQDDTALFLQNLEKKIIIYDKEPVSNIADLYLLQGIQPDYIESKYKDNPNVVIGLDTVFINKRLQYEIDKNREKPKDGLLITFGASDLESNLNKTIDKYINRDEIIYALSGVYQKTIDNKNIVFVSQQDIYKIMSQVKYAVCAYGVTFYELLFAGAEILECFARNEIDENIVEKIIVAGNVMSGFEHSVIERINNFE